MEITLPLEVSQLKYSEVTIFKDKEIGSGNFSTVFKAKCDELPCVAKYLTCREVSDHSVLEIMIECQLISALKHPNVVLCLGTVRHSEPDRPVILLEQMDENLTDLLQRRKSYLPYYVKVNICCDIVLALAYLHKNEIIHGNISSNNVLIQGESRAKLTDFWMLKILRIGTSLAQIEEKKIYMAPESLMSPPQFHKQSDSFMFGVLAIQIDTQSLPNPEKVQAPEKRRRRSNIEEMEPTSPFKRIALNCLEDNPQERPTFPQLSEDLAQLKEDGSYERDRKESRIEVRDLEKKNWRNDQIIIESEKQLQQRSAEKIKLEDEKREWMFVRKDLVRQMITAQDEAKKFREKLELLSTPSAPTDQPDYDVPPLKKSVEDSSLPFASFMVSIT